eukprot:166230-Alexandrium_andersonii.AAC.1
MCWRRADRPHRQGIHLGLPGLLPTAHRGRARGPTGYLCQVREPKSCRRRKHEEASEHETTEGHRQFQQGPRNALVRRARQPAPLEEQLRPDQGPCS